MGKQSIPRLIYDGQGSSSLCFSFYLPQNLLKIQLWNQAEQQVQTIQHRIDSSLLGRSSASFLILIKFDFIKALYFLLKSNILNKIALQLIKQQMQNMMNQMTPIFVDSLACDPAFVLKIQHQFDEDSWMHQYEKGETQEQLYQGYNEVSLVLEGLNIKDASEAHIFPEISSALAPKEQRRSMFHNFQKNLICLLKKTINIKRKELISFPYGPEAYNLWRWFVDDGSNCKRSLQIVFGVREKEKQQLLREVALKTSKFQKSLSKYGIKQLEESQRLLREMVHQKVKQVEKDVIQKSTKVKKFACFYSYFLSFIDELSEGALRLRMPKEQIGRYMTHKPMI